MEKFFRKYVVYPQKFSFIFLRSLKSNEKCRLQTDEKRHFMLSNMNSKEETLFAFEILNLFFWQRISSQESLLTYG